MPQCQTKRAVYKRDQFGIDKPEWRASLDSSQPIFCPQLFQIHGPKYCKRIFVRQWSPRS